MQRDLPLPGAVLPSVCSTMEIWEGLSGNCFTEDLHSSVLSRSSHKNKPILIPPNLSNSTWMAFQLKVPFMEEMGPFGTKLKAMFVRKEKKGIETEIEMWLTLLEASAVLIQVWRVNKGCAAAPAHMAYNTDGDVWQDSGESSKGGSWAPGQWLSSYW